MGKASAICAYIVDGENNIIGYNVVYLTAEDIWAEKLLVSDINNAFKNKEISDNISAKTFVAAIRADEVTNVSYYSKYELLIKNKCDHLPKILLDGTQVTCNDRDRFTVVARHADLYAIADGTGECRYISLQDIQNFGLKLSNAKVNQRNGVKYLSPTKGKFKEIQNN